MSSLSINKNEFQKFIIYFILFDLLFLPYFQLILFPISLPILFIYFLIGGFKVYYDFNFKIWIFFLIISILSVMNGYLFYEYLTKYFFENIKYIILLASCIFYLFFIYYSDNKLNIKTINLILKIFIGYIFILTVTLLIDPQLVFKYITTFYGRTASSIDEFLLSLRFEYLFQDPNTLAYFVLLVLGFLFHNYNKKLQLLLFTIFVLFIIIMTQSTGGLLSFILMCLIYTFKNVLKTRFVLKILILSFTVILFVSSFFLVFYLKDENIFFSYFYNRIFESDERISSGGGRLNIWAQLFYMFPLPIGRGYNLYIPEISGIRSPHSDFFGMIFRYGFLSLLPIIYFFYKKLRSCYYILIPAMITFFINSLFDSQKLLILFFILTAISNKYSLKKLSDD